LDAALALLEGGEGNDGSGHYIDPMSIGSEQTASVKGGLYRAEDVMQAVFTSLLRRWQGVSA